MTTAKKKAQAAKSNTVSTRINKVTWLGPHDTALESCLKANYPTAEKFVAMYKELADDPHRRIGGLIARARVVAQVKKLPLSPELLKKLGVLAAKEVQATKDKKAEEAKKKADAGKTMAPPAALPQQPRPTTQPLILPPPMPTGTAKVKPPKYVAPEGWMYGRTAAARLGVPIKALHHRRVALGLVHMKVHEYGKEVCVYAVGSVEAAEKALGIRGDVAPKSTGITGEFVAHGTHRDFVRKLEAILKAHEADVLTAHETLEKIEYAVTFAGNYQLYKGTLTTAPGTSFVV